MTALSSPTITHLGYSKDQQWEYELVSVDSLEDSEEEGYEYQYDLPDDAPIFKVQQTEGISGQRRICLATNVAETSLTVPGIRYVIDSGVARVSRYSVRSKVQRLPIEPISQASANQRKGRCGRVSDGICIRLFDEDDFNSRPSFTDAEILRTNLAAVILQMESLQLGAIEQFPFIDPPESRQIRDGVKLLEELGAIRHDKINATGKQLSRLPVDPRIGRMVLEAAKQGCLSEVLVIASVLGIQDPRERPADKKQQSDEVHKTHQDKESDFVSLLNLWNSYEAQRQELSQGQLRRYCQKHFLSFMRMREWRDLHRQLLLACKTLKLELNSTPADYETLHRALLAGLLSHVGFKQEDREYLGARNRKFRVFPGSNLSKGKAKWLMAAELTETSQLFARLVARIEPGWIEPLAEHLIKRSHSEPHWEKKAAQVTAFEKVTLYGLVVVPRRKVNFGAIDPETAQQIFIRSALVEGDFTTKAPFFDHNRQLLEEVAALEDRSRRRDILIDEEQLFEFYREQLIKHGGDHVVNGASFEKWRKKVEKSDAQVLFLTREALMRHGATSVNQQQYPDVLEHGGLRFRLHYNFSPGAVDDGVSVDVPVGALNRLPIGRLQWLVPGMLRDKCIALVRGLPKSLRKQCVPVPDRVDAFLVDALADDSNLTEALAYSLKRQLGVMIDNGDWDEEALDDHYRFNIRLLDADGQLLSQSRDWTALAEVFADRAEVETPTEQVQSEWQRSGIERWDFGELPLQVELDQAGMKVPAFPALCAEDASAVDQPVAGTHKRSKKSKSKKGGRSAPAAKVDRSDTATLSVRLFPTLALAQQAHRLGVIRLLQMQLARPLNELCRKLPQLEHSCLLFGKLGTKQQLLQDFQQGLLAQLYIGDDALPRNSDDFDGLLQRHKAELWPTAERLADNLQDLLIEYQAIGKKLTGNIQLSWAPVLNDIKAQLQHLLYIGFVRETPKEYWPRLSVYLKAVALRLDKFQQDLNKQRLHSEQLQQLWQEFEALHKQIAQAGAETGELTRYRWMLEEYRVSLFAQQLGTQMTVSEKRLKQQLAQCRL
ncbi:MAG: ATP-dependent RNA helicase HrpA [Motiliproteus sp.]